MKDSTIRRVAVWCAATLVLWPSIGRAQTVSEVARPGPRAVGAPAYSDVCFSSRWERPTGLNDPHDSFRAARDFHATRFDWVYTKKPEFIRRVKQMGYFFQATLNYTRPDRLTGKGTYEIGRARDLSGNVMQHAKKWHWGTRMGCASSPDYRRIWVEHAMLAVDAGADALQMDDSAMNRGALYLGGCFCPHCMAGFREYLAEHSTPAQRAEWKIGELSTFDYGDYLRALGNTGGDMFRDLKGPGELKMAFRDFQHEVTVDFYRTVHAEVERRAGREVGFSCNGADLFINLLHQVHDYALFESYPDCEGRPSVLYRARVVAFRRLDKPFVQTFVSDDMHLYRRLIALTYALGTHTVVPWDVYTGVDLPRVFAEPEQAADLYGFVRANADWLDGYEEAAIAGPDWTETRYDGPPPLILDRESQVYGVVRARPGEPDAPVVVHLVDWRDRPEAFEVQFNPTRFFGDRPIRVRLLTPPPYDAAAHGRAETTGKYATLSLERELAAGRVNRLRVPALRPWGVLVVEPMDAADEGAAKLWTPVAWPPGGDFLHRAEVVLSSPSPGAVLRYTTEGSEPTAASEAYESTLTLSERTVLKARAFDPSGNASDVLEARFEPLMVEDPELALWLRAETLGATHEDGQTVREWPTEAGLAAVVPDLKIPQFDVPAAAPTFRARAIGGRPAVDFDTPEDQLTIEGFANEQLAGSALTIFMVSHSDDPDFGFCGNAPAGTGGTPRLYVTRRSFIYNGLTDKAPLALRGGPAAQSTYVYDGRDTLRAGGYGQRRNSATGIAPVTEFGGGNLSIPFRAASRPHLGALAELIVFTRALSDAEIARIEAALARHYGL